MWHEQSSLVIATYSHPRHHNGLNSDLVPDSIRAYALVDTSVGNFVSSKVRNMRGYLETRRSSGGLCELSCDSDSELRMSRFACQSGY